VIENALMDGVFAEPPAFDMVHQPPAPYRLTLEERDAAPVSVGQAELRAKIRALELIMKSPDFDLAGLGLERLDGEDPMMLTHRFTRGIYVREFKMKAGSIIVSKLHAQEHICIISAGKAVVTTESGTQVIEAPCTFVSPAGSKRVLLIVEDMVWSTVHRSDETEVERLESELIIPEPDDYLALPVVKEVPCLG